MLNILLTAFEPYDRWDANASWLALVELTRELPSRPKLTTRLYPVDFQAARERLERDLIADYDVALHLGQAPGSASIRLEAIGINVAGTAQERPEDYKKLVEDGPVAYRSTLPLADWAKRLRENQIPAKVSYHAGTYLCNATLYLTHHLALARGLKTRAAFIHLPLSPEQAVFSGEELPTLPSRTAAQALRLILEELCQRPV